MFQGFKVLTLLLLSVALTKADGVALAERSSVELNITTRIQDYINRNKRQYDANILSLDAQLEEFETDYKHQLATIDVQRQLLEDRLKETTERLDPLEVLNDLSKHCVQKYRGNIVTTASAKSNLLSCVSSAQSQMNSYTSSARNWRNNLQSYYQRQLEKGLKDCQKHLPNSQLNYTLCVTATISQTNSQTSYYQKGFANNLESGRCSANARIKNALDCSFSSLYTTISSIAQATRLIDNCIAGLEFCPYEMCESITLYPKQQYFTNQTIINPFRVLSSNTTCAIATFY